MGNLFSEDFESSEIKPLTWRIYALGLMLCGFLLALPAAAELPDGIIIDDGYTWFSVKSVEEPVDGKATDRGWFLQYSVRFMGKVPAFTAVRTVVSRNGDKLAEARLDHTQGHSGSNLNAGQWLALSKTQNADDLVIGDGVFDVALYYVDGATDKEYLARKYQIDVRKVHRQHQLRFVNPPHYYVNHHGNVKDTIISQRTGGEGNYLSGRDGMKGGSAGGPPVTRDRNTGMWDDKNWVSILLTLPRDDDFSLSDVETGGGSRTAGTVGYLTATVDGKPVKLSHADLRFQDSAFVTVRSTEIVTHTDRYAEKYHRGTAYREPLGFARYLINLSLTWGAPEQRVESYVALNDHPGDWELKWIAEGEVLRTFSFVVDDNGMIQPHENEGEVDLTFPPRTHLVEMVIPDGGASIDSRLTDDFVSDFAFYGLGLPRAMRDVPEKGRPFPQFSGPRVEPPEAGAADRVRRQAVKDRVAAAQDSARTERDTKEAVRQAGLAADRAAAASADTAREAEIAQRNKDIEAMVESEKAKAMAEVERMKQGYQDTAEDLQTQASYTSGLPLWIRILLSVALIGGGIALAGQWLIEKVGALKPVVDAVGPLGTVLGWALLALALVGLIVDLTYLRPLIANGFPQIVAIAAGLILARGAIKERLGGLEGDAGDAGEQTAKATQALEAQEERFAILDNNASTIGLLAIAAGVAHLLLGSSALL